MKIAFIIPPFRWRVYDTISIPLGLARIIAVLKSKFNDIEIDTYDLLLDPKREYALIQNVKNHKYGLIGFQAHSDVTLHECLRLAKIIKEIYPTAVVVFGGNAATFLWKNLMKYEYVDFIVIGEGEYTIVELVEYLASIKKMKLSDIKGIVFTTGSKIVKNAERPLISNIDALPLPDRDAFEWRRYPQFSIITSRGCPYRCIFCSASTFWKGKIRYRSAENVLEEVLILKNKYRCKRFYILDDTFTLNKKRAMKIATYFIDKSLDIEWACLTRVDSFDLELLKIFKRAGCVEIHYGVESANNHTLKVIKKNITADIIAKAIEYTKKVGIRVKASVIFGLPNERYEDLLRTVKFLLDLEPNEVQIYPLMPYVGTEIYEDRESYGIEIIKRMKDWKQDAEDPPTITNYLIKSDIINAVNYAVNEFKKRGYVWIPGDIPPEKTEYTKIIKTVFGPIQGLKKEWR